MTPIPVVTSETTADVRQQAFIDAVKALRSGIDELENYLTTIKHADAKQFVLAKLNACGFIQPKQAGMLANIIATT